MNVLKVMAKDLRDITNSLEKWFQSQPARPHYCHHFVFKGLEIGDSYYGGTETTQLIKAHLSIRDADRVLRKIIKYKGDHFDIF